jgi:hypothetical protein
MGKVVARLTHGGALIQVERAGEAALTPRLVSIPVPEGLRYVISSHVLENLLEHIVDAVNQVLDPPR